MPERSYLDQLVAACARPPSVALRGHREVLLRAHLHRLPRATARHAAVAVILDLVDPRGISEGLTALRGPAKPLALERTGPSLLGIAPGTRRAVVRRCRGTRLRAGDAQPATGPCRVVRLRAAGGGPVHRSAFPCGDVRGRLVRHAARDDAAFAHRARAACVACQPARATRACAALFRGRLRGPVGYERHVDRSLGRRGQGAGRQSFPGSGSQWTIGSKLSLILRLLVLRLRHHQF
jgi:hypothetical protein